MGFGPDSGVTLMELRFFCPGCAAYNRMQDFKPAANCACAVCKKEIPLYPNEDLTARNQMTQCVLCGKTWFYHRRDFNKGLGCALLLAAILLSVWTYGISLIVAWLIDWALFKRLSRLVVCYVCDSEYKGFGTQAPDFDLHLHEKYKKYREEYASQK